MVWNRICNLLRERMPRMEKRCSFLTAPAARNSLDMIQIAKVREMRCVQRAPAKKQERYEVQTKQLAQGLQEEQHQCETRCILQRAAATDAEPSGRPADQNGHPLLPYSLCLIMMV